MCIVPRLISRSSVSLAASIGYACTGAGRGKNCSARGPDKRTHAIVVCVAPRIPVFLPVTCRSRRGRLPPAIIHPHAARVSALRLGCWARVQLRPLLSSRRRWRPFNSAFFHKELAHG